MYSIQCRTDLVLKSELIPAEHLRPHEEVVTDRMIKLKEYLETLKPYIIVPSILACKDTNVIIDGHHRYYALQALGNVMVPVTWIDYYSDDIVTDLCANPIAKADIERAAATGIMLEPKTSFHHVRDIHGTLHPLILLSVLFKVNPPL